MKKRFHQFLDWFEAHEVGNEIFYAVLWFLSGFFAGIAEINPHAVVQAAKDLRIHWMQDFAVSIIISCLAVGFALGMAIMVYVYERNARKVLSRWRKAGIVATVLAVLLDGVNAQASFTVIIHNNTTGCTIFPNDFVVTDNTGSPCEVWSAYPNANIAPGSTGTWTFSARHPAPTSVNYGLWTQAGGNYAGLSWSWGGTSGSPLSTEACSAVTLIDGNAAPDIYFWGGSCGGSGPTGPAQQTNYGCVTLQNNTSQPQYYRFTQGNTSSTVNYSFDGCSQSLFYGTGSSPTSYYQGQNTDPGGGSNINNTPSYMALYPGETITVCDYQVAGAGTNFYFEPWQAAGNAFPCGGVVGNPRCVQLCTGDDLPYNEASDTPQGSSELANNLPASGSSGTGVPGQPGGQGGNWSGTNGINEPTPLTNSYGLALDSTLRTVGAAIYGALTVGEVQAHNDSQYATEQIVNALVSNKPTILLSNLLLTNFGGIANYSNVLAAISSNTAAAYNTLSGISNIFNSNNAYASNSANSLQSLTNWGNHTNMLVGAFSGQVGTLLGSGSNVGANLSSSFTTAAGDASTFAGTINSGDGATITIPGYEGINGYSMVLGTSSFTTGQLSTMQAAGKLFVWAMYVILLIKLLDCANTQVDKLMQQRQLAGNGQELLGANAKIAFAVTYGAIMSALIASIPSAISATMVTVHGSITSNSSALATVSSLPLWGVANTFVPVSSLVTVFVSWFAFRYALCVPLTLACRAVVLFMVE